MLNEDKKWILLFWCVGVYTIYYFVPFNKHAPEYNLFPFSDQKLTYATYAHYAATYVSRMLFILTIQAFADQKYEKTFKILFYLELVGTANFILRYGESFYFEQFDMMTIRYFVWGILAAIQIIRNHRNLKYEAR